MIIQMDIVAVCVSFVVAILAIAYPILFQVVSQLDAKYSSIHIVNLFDKEIDKKFFIFFLVTSLISILLKVLDIPTLIKSDTFSFIIEDFTLHLLTLNTIFLIISFFFFVKKILIYYTPSRFLKYLFSRHKAAEPNENYDDFDAIADVLYFAIQKQDEAISKTISDFMYGVFKAKRDNNPNMPIEYPSAYYVLVYKSIEHLATSKNKRLLFLESRTIGGIWLLGELGGSKISNLTYNWLWQNIVVAVSNKRDDMILLHWENAHQYFTYHLKHIVPELSPSDFQTINSDSIEERNKERDLFLNFHYALGGLLLYSQDYESIKSMFKYTTSQPPRYELLPTSMTEVFEKYNHFRDLYDLNYPFISSHYRFPNLKGLNADGAIKNWICRYIAILYLRQFTLVSYNSTMQPASVPNLPHDQDRRVVWLENLGYFRKIIKELLDNEELKTKLGLPSFSNQWCSENRKPKPLEFIDGFKRNIENSIEQTEIEQPVSNNKAAKFYDSTKAILHNTFAEYEAINNKQLIESTFNKAEIHGGNMLMDKSAFADNQPVDHLNFHSFLAESISLRFKHTISTIFFRNKTANYLLKSEDLFPAIDKLDINGTDFVIVNFGLNLDYLKSTLNLDGLENNTYKGISIINFPINNYHLVSDSLFLLRKEDFPNIIYMPIEDEEKEKYPYLDIDEGFNLSATIVDLNQHRELRVQLEAQNPDKELRKFVWLNIFFFAEVRWKKNAPNTMLRLYSQYEERGLPNDLKDIKKLKVTG